MKSVLGALMLVLLLAGGIVLYLNGRSATSDLEAVRSVSADLRTGKVEARAFDRRAVHGAMETLESLLADPASIPAAGDRLAAVAAEAASWAEGAASGSSELHAAVSLRAAADELRAYGTDGRESHLERARSRLAAVRDALAGEPSTRGPVAGIRDRLDNVQQSQREQMQELNDAMK